MAGIDQWPYMLGAIICLVVATVITRSSFFVLPARIERASERAVQHAQWKEPLRHVLLSEAQGILSR